MFATIIMMVIPMIVMMMDDYLVEEIEWTKMIEEDDLQLQISQENLSQIRTMRKRLLDLLIFQAYTDEYNREIAIMQIIDIFMLIFLIIIMRLF
jgi:hypothetical protein